MKSIPAKDWLQQLSTQSEQHLNMAINEWQLIPHRQFACPPAAGSWSANQCLQHLNQYSRYYLPAIEKGLKQPGAHAGADFIPGLLGAYFTKMMQTTPDGQPAKKMKAMKGYDPASIVPSFDVIAEFIDHQEKLLQLLDAANNCNLNNVRIPISIAPFIKLKLGDVFAIIVAHNHRHVMQAVRAIHAFTRNHSTQPV